MDDTVENLVRIENSEHDLMFVFISFVVESWRENKNFRKTRHSLTHCLLMPFETHRQITVEANVAGG